MIARCRITDEMVREIRRRVAAGERQADLAREYKTDSSYLSNIVRRKRRSYVE